MKNEDLCKSIIEDENQRIDEMLATAPPGTSAYLLNLLKEKREANEKELESIDGKFH